MGARSVVRFSIAFAWVALAALSLGGCVTSDDSAGLQSGAAAPKMASDAGLQAQASAAPAPWVMRTPFGILYSITPRQTIDYPSKQKPGTIIVDTRDRYLYFILGHGQAIRYTIAVGAEGYAWSGTSTVSDKREWPDWTPTPSILKRFPNLPHHIPGGYDNPLGARALYLGHTLYRIHGTNEPWRIGTEASSGCIRLSNEDAIDLYNRTKIGATVIVRR